MMNLFLIGSGLFGLIVGSFLNVVVLRFGTGLPISRGRSRCFSCDHTLAWYELIPLFSYVIQMGRCRHCGSRISIQYPLVEALTAGLFVMASLWLANINISGVQDIVMGIVLYIIVSMYVVIITYDVKHKMIPDSFSYSVAVATLVFTALSSPLSLMDNVLAGFGAFLFFFIFWFFSKGRWMGLGDAKLALSLGFLLGPLSAVPALLIAFWSGALISIVVLIYERMTKRDLGITMKSEIPFAPFIIFGLLFAFFWQVDMGTLASWFAI